ncbi:YhgE/Pip domain-containing protein [Corynebacterium halotolerans]|uniref:Membrane protein n=1 Tax=Corynebacterium halotolerans YIM 70093 = DSM 44683 TaxID=1121362 RepID=M1NYM0_9CORY|nr:YhgE/Pip domain-containing protein [Corynebacterium halotolerans]AGF72595.1 membrane protein [Corynebacterium halotolerans YIM 70093 = DSM 44683]
MNLTHLGSELRRFGHGTLPPLGLAVIVLLPLIFGGLFVWSYFDPIGGMSRLPVALVNSDQGAELDGEKFSAGEQVTGQLLDNEQVHFVEVTADQARQGVADGTYYFALELPRDFSEAAVSAGTGQPHPATINATYNNTNGFIGTTLGNQVTTQVVRTVDAALGEKVTDTLLVGFNTIGAGLDEASSGAAALAEGTGSAREGAGELADGASALDDGARELNDGAVQLRDGATELDTGLGTAAQGADQLSGGLDELVAATDSLGEGAGAIAGGVDQIAGLGEQAGGAQDQLAAQLTGISAQLRSTGLPGAAELSDRIDAAVAELNASGLGVDSPARGQLAELQEGAAELQRQLSDSDAPYRSGVDSAVRAAAELATGLHMLSDGSAQLVVGTNRLADGTSELVGGTQQLTVGAAQLRDGLVDLDEGAGQLSLRLNEGAGQVPRYPDGNRADTTATVATPVTEKLTGDQLTRFGVGLAPFFISLGLFMGGTVMFMVLRALQRRAIDSGMPAFRAVLATFLPAVLVGWAQTTMMWAVLVGLIGLAPAHPLGLLLAMGGISTCFVAITQAINAFFGSAVGRVLCLIIMALSLVSSGGLYPPETQPAFQRAVHVVDPITYSVNLLRQAIIGTSELDPRLWQSVAVLGVFLVGFLAVSTFAAWRGRILRQKDLHPELAL